MRLLRAELTKLVFQKRTYVGWAGLLAVPVILTVALSLSTHPDRGGAMGFLVRASRTACTCRSRRSPS